MKNDTVEQALRAAVARLPEIEGRREAELLLAYALQKSKAWMIAHGNERLEPDQLSRYEALVARRVQGEPVAYLIGRRGFWAFDLMVTPDTLIPRPETELLVELALERASTASGLRVLDLGTGSGAIALAIAYERRQAEVIACDISSEALAVARANARALGLSNVEFRQGDWWGPLAGERFDLIVSNPPYIAEDDPHLYRGDLRYEPLRALASGRDGLDAVCSIVRDACRHSRPQGWLLLEHGWTQGEMVRDLLRTSGFACVRTVRDLEARERVTLGCMLEP
ncbi:MAG: peptide chain release factor N(5)-glutamine methyltransferase [Lysobacteraceae bacterium]|nr:MAG: peptide chain release factor N(5)-glutamine methyltransferase [Xanthomonadaceae bacterium]